MSTVQHAEKLLTVEEYAQLPPSEVPTELIKGRIVEMNVPKPRHGTVMTRTARIIDEFVESHDLGIVPCGDAGIVTERNPDSIRGADVAFFSYQRLPRNANLNAYPRIAPEIVFEVRSTTDRWSKVLEKVAEYLNAGVLRVCVLDPQDKTIRVYLPDEPETVLTENDELRLPELHKDFCETVARFFP